MVASNLPPGVTEGMIPGNRPEDILYEEVSEGITPEDVEENCTGYECDHAKTDMHQDGSIFFVSCELGLINNMGEAIVEDYKGVDFLKNDPTECPEIERLIERRVDERYREPEGMEYEPD